MHGLLQQFYEDKDFKKGQIRNPKGKLLILDRSFDLIAPIQHDYYYQSNVAEFRDGFKNDDGELKVDSKTIFLNDQDELWVRFRNKHSIEVFSEINEEVKKIVSQNKARASMKTEEMTL